MARNSKTHLQTALVVCALALAAPGVCRAQTAPDPGSDQPSLEKLLPPSIAQNTDINAWGWLSYLRNTADTDKNYWNGDFAFGLTQRLGDNLALSADIHFIDDNNLSYGFLEQAFATAQLNAQTGTLLTVGKFNASIGAEARNEWDRLGGTTSLLFGAEPQDLVGLMLSQPLGDGQITLRPFLTTQFQGHADFDGPPYGGLIANYRLNDNLSFTFTNMLGPGFVAEDDDADDDENYSTLDSTENWYGPNFDADRGGLLYFVDLSARWMPRPDLTLQAEGLLATVGHSAGTLGWAGLLALVNYDLSDRWRIFGRWSYLNDNLGIITGEIQSRNEISVGVGWQFIRGWELRGEYRHDYADTGDIDSVSAHLTFSF
jgi:hypothetical protein